MICIECTKHAESLYTVYSNKHIQLTDCKNCNQVTDRYIEIDNVLLFMDLLLLKPGAYRHLVFNSLELKLSKYPESLPVEGSPQEKSKIIYSNFKNWIVKFDTTNRFWILLVAFEVYLTWSAEEHIYGLNQQRVKDDKYLLLNRILSADPLNQYLSYAGYCIVDMLIFYYLILFCVLRGLQWGKEMKYRREILSYTILLSYGAKIFPILMLIWPYDTFFSMNVIQWVANLYLIESLRIVTRLPYTSILSIFILVTIMKGTISRLFLISCFGSSIDEIKLMINSEIQFLLQKFNVSTNFL
ncbi:hypothetical protein Kpol_1043p50 [Vanderwaltozyma polyspora DSM 70294]|uniref:Protein ARV n=1 Tax=Vanderwaltozyma polyspora (strain ATCC 22028 / DSM 70294 / BCRC 21397 / CBS 2163 / NBRC 10782 / NRRL Y-8283 / UCD 57-17) TaxID=436907 RepID=A7TIR8_VANPO|nr:uncharacterized protein Kpol_1043p50 [Vanderwaltozyma polyspora DSM 70294]EDO17860.1 hypothetical protein Kpol_1043p50 [Vanderwaltozyma polyspora DSM 70294]